MEQSKAKTRLQEIHAKLLAILKAGLQKAILMANVKTVLEISCLKYMEVGKVKYSLKILKEEQLSYFGKDPIIIQITMKDNTILTNWLCSLIIFPKK